MYTTDKDIMLAIDMSLVNINEILKTNPVGYHFTSEVRISTEISTDSNSDRLKYTVSILAIEDGEPEYHPVQGDMRKSVSLIQESFIYPNTTNEEDVTKLKILVSQRLLDRILSSLLLGKNNPFTIRLESKEKIKSRGGKSNVKLVE